MHYDCYECGEQFDMPFYKKNKVGMKVACCPFCGNTDDIEEVEDERDREYDDIIEWEDLTDEEE